MRCHIEVGKQIKFFELNNRKLVEFKKKKKTTYD